MTRDDWPLPEPREPNCPPYADRFFWRDGTFKSPVLAAEHACLIQGGFSTPAIEAQRMIRDGGLGAISARAWLLSGAGAAPQNDAPWAEPPE